MKNYLFLSFALFANLSWANVIEFSDWQVQRGYFPADWAVADDGKSVVQSEHSNPSFFTSQDEFFNTRITGQFGVQDNNDDDFIGFVFGFSGLDDYYLFDWKRFDQVYRERAAYEGFRLSKISDGKHVNLWDHTGDGISLLASDYGEHLGWDDNIVYSFSLVYTESTINIAIDGGQFEQQNIFSLTGLQNTQGKLGFYNYSQGSTFYRDLHQQACTENCAVHILAEPDFLWIGVIVLVLLILASRASHVLKKK